MRDADVPASHGGALSQVDGRPRLDPAPAAGLLRSHWGIAAELSPLPSERDQNWLVGRQGRPEFVLKVANRSDGFGVIDLQQQMMKRLSGAGVPCPRVITASSGEPCIDTPDGLAWLITAVPGASLADTKSRSTRLLHRLGQVLGEAQRALTGFDHPAAHRHIQWDVCNAAEVLDTYRDHVTDPAGRDALAAATTRFEQRLSGLLADLPRATIHNDANDHNVLVSGDRVTGLIDFGDAVHTVRANDLAIACAYAMLDAPDPDGVMAAITAGFRTRGSLEPEESAALPDLIVTRLAMSVSISAYQRTLAPDDTYLHVSEAPAWRLLTRLTMGRE